MASVTYSHISANGTMWLWDTSLRTYIIVGYTSEHPDYGMDEGR